MDIKIEHGKEMTIKFAGRLDTVSSLELSKKLESEEIKEELVIFDMKETEYVSSAGLRLLISLKKTLAEQNKSLEIHNLNDIFLILNQYKKLFVKLFVDVLNNLLQ